MSLLITSSLVDSVSWAKSAPDSVCRFDESMSWKQRAYEDLKNTLARIWTGGNAVIERGMRVEKAICEVSLHPDLDSVKCSDMFRFVVKKCVGGQFQKRTKKFMEIDGDEYCLFGKMDVWFPGKIIDLKTTEEYKGKSKYLGNFQHKMYCLNERIRDFEYVVMEFGSVESNEGDVIKAVHSIEYHVEDFNKLEEEVTETIRNTLTFIEQFDEPGDLKDLYLHKFSMYN